MFSRRDTMKWGVGGFATTILGASMPGLARAEKMTALSALGEKNFHKSMVKILSRSDRVAVPSYRFGVVMRSGIAATGNSGSARVEASADLVGVDMAMLQQIAHQGFSDFVSRLRATGRTVLGWNEISATPGFAKLDPTPVPFVKKPFADARTVAMVAPEYLPLVNIHLDGISDKGAFSLGNAKALNAMSAELRALVMIPSIVLDFAALTGSGHAVYGGAASVGVQPGLFMVPLFTSFGFYHGKDPRFGEYGRLILEDRIAIGQAGELVQTASFNNRAEIEEWNSYVNSMAWWNEPNLAGPSRPTQAYDFSNYQYRVEPDAFSAACLAGAKAVHSIYLGAVDANRPV